MFLSKFFSWLKKDRAPKPLVHDLDHKLVQSVRPRRRPSLRQLKYLPQFFSPLEKKLVRLLSLVILLTALLWSGAFVWGHHLTVPKEGGEYSEAMVGQPKLINPLFASSNEVDADLSALVYSGLFRYNADQKLLPDLAASYKISDDKKTYTVALRQDVKWSDGEPFTADDVVFTFETIQDPETGSPLITAFAGVKVEKTDDYTVSFTLKDSFAPFLGTLIVGLLPEHIWGEISPAGQKLAKNNLQPVGTGPWMFNKMVKDDTGNIQSYSLARNEKYYSSKPYLKTLTFKFFTDYNGAGDALHSQSLSALSFVPRQLKEKIASKNINFYQLWLPQYTALFLNQGASALKDSDVRKSLAMGLDKKTILQEALGGEGEIIDGPIPQGLLGYYPNIKKPSSSPAEANALLDKKWTRMPPEDYFKNRHDELVKERDTVIEAIRKNPSSTPEEVSSTIKKFEDEITVKVRAEMNADQHFYRKDKNGKVLALTITTADTLDYSKAAETVAKMWRAIGVKVEVQTMSSRELTRDALRNRSYEVLLYGEIVGSDPDPYPFWHSTQGDYPGLNLSVYVNRNADKILEEARTTLNEAEREKLYKKFQDLVAEDIPAIFLYNPAYTLAVNKEIKGIRTERIFAAADRYNDLGNWYIKTKWQWK